MTNTFTSFRLHPLRFLQVCLVFLIALAFVSLLIYSFVRIEEHNMDKSNLMVDPNHVVIITTTRYEPSDLRYQLALETAREAAKAKIRLVVVDSSPNEVIRRELAEAGAIVYQQQETRPTDKSKGGALRQALQFALDQVKDLPGRVAISFQEPEKVDLVRLQLQVVEPIFVSEARIVIPHRSSASLSRYPVEQQHSETFGNLHLHNVAVRHGLLSRQDTPLDWFFGPFSLERSQASFFLSYQGPLWDAQLVPIVMAAWKAKKDGVNQVIHSVQVDFAYPEVQRKQEEGSVEFGEKRLMQVNMLVPILTKAIIDREL